MPSALLVYRAAWVRDVQGRRNSREAALAKLHATDSAQQVIDKAVQIFGGLGVTHGVPVERLYREIRALRIYEGASEVQKVVIARNHLAEHQAMKALLPPGWPRPKGYANGISAKGRLIVTAGVVGWNEGEEFETDDARRPVPSDPRQHARHPRRGRSRAGAYRADDLVHHRPRRLPEQPSPRSARPGAT